MAPNDIKLWTGHGFPYPSAYKQGDSYELQFNAGGWGIRFPWDGKLTAVSGGVIIEEMLGWEFGEATNYFPARPIQVLIEIVRLNDCEYLRCTRYLSYDDDGNLLYGQWMKKF